MNVQTTWSRLAKTAPFLFLLLFIVGCKMGDLLSKGNSNDGGNPPTVADKKDGGSTGNLPAICQNSYYPVGPNVERKYHIVYAGNSIAPRDYTERFSDFNGDQFVAKTEFDTVVATINWRCTSDGLLATQYNNSVDMKTGTSVKLDTLESSGVTFPKDWNQGDKWTTSYTIKETINNPKGEKMGEGNGTVKQEGEVVGTEEVTVPAGKYQTIKVSLKTTLNIVIKVGAMNVPATNVVMQTTAWLAKDVGVVKNETGMGGVTTATSELLSSKTQ